MPKFSCVIATHSRPDLLCSAIESILTQHGNPDFEIIVVRDGGSNVDYSAPKKLLRKQDSFVELQVNRGVSAVRNKGIYEATGQFVSFLDDDDRWVPHFLVTMHEELGDYDLVYGKLAEEIGDGKRYSQAAFHGQFDSNKLLYGNYISPIAVMAKKETLLKWQGFDEELFQNGCWGGEDWLLWVKAVFVYGAVFKQVPAVMAINYSRAPNKTSIRGEQGGYRASAEWFERKYNISLPGKVGL